MKTQKSLLDKVKFPKDLKKFDDRQLKVFCKELRDEVIDAVSVTGGHLGAGLGVWRRDGRKPARRMTAATRAAANMSQILIGLA